MAAAREAFLKKAFPGGRLREKFPRDQAKRLQALIRPAHHDVKLSFAPLQTKSLFLTRLLQICLTFAATGSKQI
jgi:hypothetical protein